MESNRFFNLAIFFRIHCALHEADIDCLLPSSASVSVPTINMMIDNYSRVFAFVVKIFAHANDYLYTLRTDYSRLKNYFLRSFNHGRCAIHLSGRWRREEKQRTKNEEAAARAPGKTDDEILACISDAYINKVLILSERSFVSPPFSPESKTFLSSPEGMWVNTLRGTCDKRTREGITTRKCKGSRQSCWAAIINNVKCFNALHVSSNKILVLIPCLTRVRWYWFCLYF